MKILAMVAMAAVMSARADEVPVYVQGLSAAPAPVLSRAQVLANEIFAGVSVTIDWRRGRPTRSEFLAQKPIIVELVTDTPMHFKPGALAFALPFEGVHINVFYDRVQDFEPELRPYVLAHVLVHEITHILQGTSLHSHTGIMKARWNRDDYTEMSVQSLAFTEEDIELIRFGLAKRVKAGSLIAAAPAP